MINKKVLGAPYYVWMILFTVAPMLLILYYSFTNDGAFTLEHYEMFFDPLYIGVLWRSLYLAFACTVLCLLIGYPVAMILASPRFVEKRYLLFLCILPMWMNMLLRIYGWMSILETNGILNTFLGWLGLGPYQFLYTSGAVLLGMVYDFLPFMILPIYSIMVKIDRNVIEAAEDLGANSLTVFRKIILPLSLPGILTGITMVFMPAVTTFAISRLMGGGQITMIGNLIEQQFITVYNWGFGSAIAIIMMVMILLTLFILNRSPKAKDGIGGGML